MGNQNGSMVLGLKTRIKYVPWLAGWCMGRSVCAAPPCPRECRCVSVFSAGHWLSVLSHVHQGTVIWMEDLVGTALHYYLPGTGMKWGDTAHKLWPAREHHTGLCPLLSLLSLPWDLGQSACPRCRGDDYRSIVGAQGGCSGTPARVWGLQRPHHPVPHRPRVTEGRPGDTYCLVTHTCAPGGQELPGPGRVPTVPALPLVWCLS